MLLGSLAYLCFSYSYDTSFQSGVPVQEPGLYESPVGLRVQLIFNLVKQFVPNVLNLCLPTALQLKVKRLANFPSHKLIFLWSMGQISPECIYLKEKKPLHLSMISQQNLYG